MQTGSLDFLPPWLKIIRPSFPSCGGWVAFLSLPMLKGCHSLECECSLQWLGAHEAGCWIWSQDPCTLLVVKCWWCKCSSFTVSPASHTEIKDANHIWSLLRPKALRSQWRIPYAMKRDDPQWNGRYLKARVLCLESMVLDWPGGSVGKSSYYCCRGPEFRS